MVLPVFVLGRVRALRRGTARLRELDAVAGGPRGRPPGCHRGRLIGLAENGCVADESAEIGSGNPGAHVCPVSHSAFDAHIASAVNRMAVSVGPLAAVHVSCNEGSVSDPAPSGAWNDAPGGGGNGCKDGAGESNGTIGDLVSVRVEYTYSPMTPVISSILGTIGLSGSASMVIH